MAQVKLSAVGKAYGDVRVLKDVHLDIRDGEFVVFVGPSGCGKSTLLRMIAGLEEITEGDLYIGEQRVNDCPPADRGIAMVFQSYALYPHMNLYDNMAFSLKLSKVPAAQIDEAVQSAAKILHIEHLLDRKPKDLSGGQRQRVAIGRAIVRKPEVFLFDEPLSNLDAALRVRMRYEFARLHEDLQATMIYVTHDQVEAMTLADKMVVLSAGRVEQVGHPLALYENPANIFVAGFIGSPKMNFLEARVVSAGPTGTKVQTLAGEHIQCLVDAESVQEGDAVTLGIRPEHLRRNPGAQAEQGNTLRVTWKFVESLGSSAHAYADYPGAVEGLTVQVDPRQVPSSGAEESIQVPADSVYLFDASGRALRRLTTQAAMVQDGSASTEVAG